MSRLRHLASPVLLASGLVAPATALALASPGAPDTAATGVVVPSPEVVSEEAQPGEGASGAPAGEAPPPTAASPAGLEGRSGGTPGPSGLGPTVTSTGPSSGGAGRRSSRGDARRHELVERRHAGGRPVKLTARAVRLAGGTPAPAPTHSARRPVRLEAGLGVDAATSLTTGTLEPAPAISVPVGLSLQGSAPPAFLLSIYKQAARRYDVPWRVLAAINSIETDYGRDLSVSSAGAEGWMQFLPSTWALYGDNGNPYDPHDAIFAAARLLHAAGAAQSLPKAIFAYNHADWYVAAVLWRASTIDVRDRAGKGHRHGYSLPLDRRYMRTLGRTDDGVDIETPPDGAAVYSIASGIVVAVASDPGGFGPNYPVVLTTSGPLEGRYIYYGHVAASLVRVGQPVMAGQPIAVVGHTGDAAGLGHGHIEIGFCDSNGDPLNHHGVAEAWTPSGQVMRSVLVSLSAKLAPKTR